MLEFPEHFFEAEEREGFLVDQTMKTMWAAEMEVLQEVAIICERHNLTWYAGFGTLLGTVRHQGFIPWDDDIDIVMKREDYMKLLEYLPQELPNGFDVRCSLVEDDFLEYQCTVFNADTVSIEPERLRRFHGCPFIAGIDIFPLDYLHRDPQRLALQRNIFRLIRTATWVIKNEEESPKKEADIQDALESIYEHCGVKLTRKGGAAEDVKLVSALWRLGNEVAMQYDRRCGEYLANYLNYARFENAKFDKHWFDEVEYLPFEQVMMPVPKEYDKVLRTIYGNYMVVRKQTQSHDYPVYKKQLELVREAYRAMENAINEQETAGHITEE